ncbi:hypothetical protein PQX77_014941, partial [Marasmius sp. AFHP31]
IEVDFLDQDFRGPLRLHLENSKDNPLHLRVRRKADRFMTRQPTKHGIELWALLGPHIHRYRVLALEGNGYEALPKYPDASLPQLRELSLGDTSRHIDEQSWLWQAMQNAPRLTVADLSRAHELEVSPHSQLTKICIRGFRAKCHCTGFPLDLLRALSACTNLERLDLKCSFDDQDGQDTLPPSSTWSEANL